jgi:hypothetical protein
VAGALPLRHFKFIWILPPCEAPYCDVCYVRVPFVEDLSYEVDRSNKNVFARMLQHCLHGFMVMRKRTNYRLESFPTDCFGGKCFDGCWPKLLQQGDKINHLQWFLSIDHTISTYFLPSCHPLNGFLVCCCLPWKSSMLHKNGNNWLYHSYGIPMLNWHARKSTELVGIADRISAGSPTSWVRFFWISSNSRWNRWRLSPSKSSLRYLRTNRTGPGVDSATNRNEYQESLKIKQPGGKVRPARRADNLAAIY